LDYRIVQFIGRRRRNRKPALPAVNAWLGAASVAAGAASAWRRPCRVAGAAASARLIGALKN